MTAENIGENQHLSEETRKQMQERIDAAIPGGMVVIPNIRFDFDGLMAFALHTLHLPTTQAIEWVQKQFDSMVEELNHLKPGDFILSAMTGGGEPPHARQP